MENNKTSFHKFMDATQGVKVELGLIEDINAQLQNAFKIYDVQSPLISAQMQVKKAKGEYVNALAKAEDALKKAKDLGSEMLVGAFQKTVSEAKGAIGMCDRLIAAIDKAIQAV
jgi:hypothetical protein